MINLEIIQKKPCPATICDELAKIGADPSGIAMMQDKFNPILLKIFNLKTPAALIIKQEMLAKGGEAATHRDMITHKILQGDVLLSGTKKQYKALIKNLKLQPFGLKKLAEHMETLLSQDSLPVLRIRNTLLDFNQTPYLMGVLNITPDSFSDGGKYNDRNAALEHADQMIAEGVDILDIGGQSTRPGAQQLGAEDELKRILPVISGIRKNSGVPISVDTFYADVARAALDAGADLINDISALRFDPRMAGLAAEKNCPLVLMHMKGTPQNMQSAPHYNNLILDIIRYLEGSIQLAIETGVNKKNIILDPGIGFGKTLEHNLCILKNLEEFQSLGFPLLVGTSRKSFIGKLLNDDVNERLIGTIISNTVAIMNGANIIRVHDIREIKKIIIVTNAIKNSEGGV